MDESRGVLAYDYVGGMTGMLAGDPIWQAEGGQIDGAIELDGASNYLQTGTVLSPADGPFTVAAWVQGGGPGQVILSSAAGPIWLSLDRETGGLRTNLAPVEEEPLWSPRRLCPMVPGIIVALVWDGATRILYVDGVEVARRSAGQLERFTGLHRFGAGPSLESDHFWRGLIDDLRMYNRALSPEELAELGSF